MEDPNRSADGRFVPGNQAAQVFEPDALSQDMRSYADSSPLPIVAEFAYQHGISRQYVYDLASKHPAVSDALKYMLSKKEAKLEQGALLGKLNPSMAIFSLKQLGWRDRQEVDHTSGGKPLIIASEVADKHKLLGE